MGSCALGGRCLVPARSAARRGAELNRSPESADATRVSQDPEKDDLEASAVTLLPRLGEVVSAALDRFGAQPFLGVVLVDATPLARIEAQSGGRAREQALASVGSLVRELATRILGEDAVVATGETGRCEIVVFAFRSTSDRAFYREDLPHLTRALEAAIERRGHRLVYPHSKHAPTLGVGFAASVRNPYLAGDTQLRSVLEEARGDAHHARQTLLRRRRRAFMDVLFSGRVTSVYEPIVSVASKTVFGYEALARGPQGTEFHSPLVLFGAAEEEGLIFELDCLCRESGLDGARELPHGTNLFLNVRPTTIHDPKFRPDAVIRTLEASKLTPADVVFEISEQESIGNFAAFREIRDEYRSLGFRFALDDTGAGYASLQAVIELEPEFIKVDRALITGLDTDRAKQTLMRALQGVAASLGSQIIGEGLDTLEELGMLGELGIAFGQGWLFGKPTPLRAG